MAKLQYSDEILANGPIHSCSWQSTLDDRGYHKKLKWHFMQPEFAEYTWLCQKGVCKITLWPSRNAYRYLRDLQCRVKIAETPVAFQETLPCNALLGSVCQRIRSVWTPILWLDYQLLHHKASHQDRNPICIENISDGQNSSRVVTELLWF